MHKKQINPENVLANLFCTKCLGMNTWDKFVMGREASLWCLCGASVAFCCHCGTIVKDRGESLEDCNFFDHYIFGPGDVDISGFPLSEINAKPTQRPVRMRLAAVHPMIAMAL